MTKGWDRRFKDNVGQDVMPVYDFVTPLFYGLFISWIILILTHQKIFQQKKIYYKQNEKNMLCIKN